MINLEASHMNNIDKPAQSLIGVKSSIHYDPELTSFLSLSSYNYSQTSFYFMYE